MARNRRFVSSLAGSLVTPLASAITGIGGVALPLDNVSSAVLAFSVARRLRTDYTGSLIRVRRSSDNAEQDIGYTSGNVLDESALASFVGANDGFVTKVYDQVGSADATQATAADQPQIVSSGALLTVNGRPAMETTPTRALDHSLASTMALRDDHALVVALEPTAAMAGYHGVFATDGDSMGLLLLANLDTAAKWGTWLAGTEYPAGAGLANATRYVLSMERAGGGVGQFRTNGAADGTYSPTQGQIVGNFGGLNCANQGAEALVGEAILSNDAADRAAVEADLISFWGA